MIKAGKVLAALGIAIALSLWPGESIAGGGNMKCAKRDTVASGSSVISKVIAKFYAEVAWELKAVNKYGPLWYSWWAADNHRFSCRKKGARITCVARGKPCRLL